MSDIAGVGAVQNSQYKIETERASLAGNDGLGQDAFFKILITQLQNQDPLDPMEDKEFISQMAEFSSLEKVEKIYGMLEQQFNVNQLAGQADLIGKEITAEIEGVELKGTVDGVKSKDEQIWVVLENGSEIRMDHLTAISKAGGSEEEV
ncbi:MULTISPECIES: flagellar hook capping FlgD N-terminal domain-containing protein [unclassified Halanaerobium]|jgi:flagellar basal-body rod modification protein FlgD|uniref:flagellar hook capping FlgD N-terminal domain-containing protein n=1 Tax=unclassified Halanaerobium TaxID=2641197 RepID=UPI000DF388D9|nr:MULTISPECIES: flagellar hook capping FlgD N-terminal domain-containing protein [unclassified Halanaerobium]RCW47688.1 flagellar basal-body rod modification protein FlgD [Halanaerobium sp. MA284_MarDTE_T2]RCW84668.1 flagellar basal-body rod modification protein FlgD [Halanaerobium sp. DL-01]